MPVSVALPLLVSVTVCAPAAVLMVVAAKVSGLGESTASGPAGAAVLVPLRDSVCVAPAVPPELSVMVRVAAKVAE